MSDFKKDGAPFSAAEGRRFGFLVGGAFLVLGALSVWRGRSVIVAGVLAGIGLTLAIWALVAPARLGTVYRAWMGIAKVLAPIMTPVFMSVMYFVVLTPVALVRRLAGGNPLISPGPDSFWSTRTATRGRSMERQF
jgi:hypothetical protein